MALEQNFFSRFNYDVVEKFVNSFNEILFVYERYMNASYFVASLS